MKGVTRGKIFILCILLIFVSGCATWTRVGGSYSTPAEYHVDLPWGWMKYRGKDLLITRDGFFLENIEIKRIDIDKKLEHTKKKFLKGMLPEDIAEVLIDDIIADPDFHNFELIENIPITLSGQDAFRLTYIFSNKDGLKYKVIKYGFGYEDWIYTLTYASVFGHYFDKYLKDFNRVIESFKFIPSKDHKTIIPAFQEKEERELVVKKEEIKVEPTESRHVAVDTQPKVATYAEYYRLLYNTISRAVVKPEGSGTGVINAAFTLLNDGTLEDVNILDGSAEDVALRDAVVKAVKDSAPFPAFPDEIKEEGGKTFTITIEFRNTVSNKTF